jgi:hypothetical protein
MCGSIACHAALATTSLQVTLKAEPMCMLIKLGPLKTSTTTLYSSCPERGILLILNSRAVVMPMCPNRSHRLLVGIGPSFSKVFNSLASWYLFSFSESLKGVQSSSSSSSSSSLSSLMLLMLALLLLLLSLFSSFYDNYCSSVIAPCGSCSSGDMITISKGSST